MLSEQCVELQGSGLAPHAVRALQIPVHYAEDYIELESML